MKTFNDIKENLELTSKEIDEKSQEKIKAIINTQINKANEALKECNSLNEIPGIITEIENIKESLKKIYRDFSYIL